MIVWIFGFAGLLLFGSFFGKSKTPNQSPPKVAAARSRPAETWDDLRLGSLDAEIQNLDRGKFFPACSSLSPLLVEASTSADLLRKRQSWVSAGGGTINASEAFKRFVKDPVAFRDAIAGRVIAAELAKWALFFDSIEKQPLTPEQRLAVVTEEDATLVLAGAGSGKTSVITAKAAYLVKAGIRKPDEILLLAFARDAADEMSERITARTGLDVAARTFHALAYDILGAVEGTKPALAAHATDDKAFFAMLREILQEIIAAANAVTVTLIAWLTGLRLDIKTEMDFKTKQDWYHHVERLNLRTLQGDQVRSFEELTIANWLYVNGIAYEYEPVYQHSVPQAGRKQYTPDFRLTESGVYIEHFGVRRTRGPRGEERLTTAPFVDREEYLAGMAWKRKVHADCGTVLVETYSYDRDEGMLTQRLAERLAPHIEPRPRSPQEIYDRVAEMGQVDGFITLLATFLRHFKSSGLTIDACRSKAGAEKMAVRGRAFLTLFEAVYAKYREKLGLHIDFEDMILKATAHVEAGRYQSPFRHILVDEFQDISRSRSRLIAALKKQQHGTKLFAVGDDWQSIYRFAGADMQIMTSFGAIFGGIYAGHNDVHRTVDLGRTFRSVDKIALAARRFVLQNPAQMRKETIPAGKATSPAIRVVLTQRHQPEDPLQRILTEICASKPGQRQSVLLLARNNRQLPHVTTLSRSFPNLAFDVKTIHRSKGLEADHVILLGAEGGQFGFPSMNGDDPLLGLVMPTPERFEHAEERRVMYVAMTRARYTFTIIAPEARPSEFVEELLKDPSYEVLSERGTLAEPQICGECGGKLVPVPTSSGNLRYRCEHTVLCGNDLPSCPECSKALPRKPKGGTEASCGSCHATFPACPSCSDGWLVPRKGRYGDFLGCVRYPQCSRKKQETARGRGRQHGRSW